jgi:hypothetical protein
MCKFIDQSDEKHMTSQIKTITSVLKASTDIFTKIPARPIGLTEILAIMSVSIFKINAISSKQQAKHIHKKSLTLRNEMTFPFTW